MKRRMLASEQRDLLLAVGIWTINIVIVASWIVLYYKS